jgi:hypothetical protein
LDDEEWDFSDDEEHPDIVHEKACEEKDGVGHFAEREIYRFLDDDAKQLLDLFDDSSIKPAKR